MKKQKLAGCILFVTALFGVIIYDIHIKTPANVLITIPIGIQSIKTDQGVNCTTAKIGESVAIDCNYDEWNAKTNYGQYPYAEATADNEEKEITWQSEFENYKYEE